MKSFLKYPFILVFLSIASWANSQQKVSVKIDEIGNAKIEITATMNAQQWQVWLANLGNNPAALKHEIESSMPAVFLDNFKLSKDDMNRSFTLSLNAYGLCKINKKGKWIIETDQKNAQITELDDGKYMLMSNPADGLGQQTYLIEFPDEAKKIKIDEDAFGQTIFKFDMNNSTSNLNITRWAGILLLLIGGGMIGLKSRSKIQA